MLVKNTLPIAAIFGATGVILGAFGAHALPGWLESRSLPPEEIARYVDVYETGARYHLIHALALWGVGLLLRQQANRWASAAVVAWVLGILVFSGCLYALAITGVKILGAIVPLGGVALIVGWICLAVAAMQINRGV